MQPETSGRRQHITAMALGAALLALVGCGGATATSMATATRGGTLGTAVRDYGATPGLGTPRPGIATRDYGTVPATFTPVPPLSPTRAVVPEPPADFAFVYVFTQCGERDTADTFAGTFSHFVPEGAYRAGTRTIPLVLTPAELRAIDEQIVASDFFALLAAASRAGDRTLWPNADYELRVRRNGAIHEVRWSHVKSTPTAAEAALARLADTIRFVLRSHPEVQAVPRGVGCT